MVALAECELKKNRQKTFWENMADHYPLPFDSKTLVDTGRIIAIAEAAGVVIDHATILDIGCGTGTYTLPLALRAAQVTGIDSSEKMLGYCKRERAAHNLENVRLVQLDWTEGDIESLGFAGGFDIVWASMTPAIRTRDDLAKMRRCAKQSCVSIGWGNLRKNDLLEEVFTAHSLVFGPPPGAAGAVRAMLNDQGITPLTTQVKSRWDWQGTREEACRNAAGYLEAGAEAEVQYDIIERIISRYCKDGKVSHTTHVEMEVLVWHES
jgi:SAM-dependent methyltransferase